MSKDSSKDKKSADLGRPWAAVLITTGIFVISQFIAALLVGLGYKLGHPDGSLTEAFNYSAPVQFIYILFAEGLAALLAILVVKKVKKAGLAAIGFGRWPQLRDIVRALLGFGAFYAILIAASIIIKLIVPDLNTEQPQEIGFDSLNSSLDYLLAFSALALLPPLGEETLMRGYLYSVLRARWSFAAAMLVTSLLFGLAHLGSGSSSSPLWVAGIDTFLLSLVLVYLRESTGALYAGMLLHALNNMIAFIVHF